MEKTQEEALKRALVFLTAAGVEYVIRTDDGRTIGILPIAEPAPEKKIRRTMNTTPGLKELRQEQQKVLEQMQPGDCKRFSIKEFDMHTVRGGLTGWCANRWGPGAHISTWLKETNEIEILRVE